MTVLGLKIRGYRLILFLLCVSNLWSQEKPPLDLCNDYVLLKQGAEMVTCVSWISIDSVKLRQKPEMDSPSRTFPRKFFQLILSSVGDTLLPKLNEWNCQAPRLDTSLTVAQIDSQKIALQNQEMHRLDSLAHLPAALRVMTLPEDALVRLDQGEWQHSPIKFDSIVPGVHLVEAWARAIGKEWFASRSFGARPGLIDTLSLQLKATHTSLYVNGDPKIETHLYLDRGSEKAEVPLDLPVALEGLPLDNYHLRFVDADGRDSVIEKTLRPFGPTEVFFSWDSLKSSANKGKIFSKWLYWGQGLQGAILLSSLYFADLSSQHGDRAIALRNQLDRPSFQGSNWNSLRQSQGFERQESLNDLKISGVLALISLLGVYPLWIYEW